jgi:ATP-dependent Zn protease
MTVTGGDVLRREFGAAIERGRSAYHEAGHAVAGRALGLPCGRATIVPKRGKYAGYAVVSTRGPPVQHRIVVGLAGAMAEAEYFGAAACDGIDGERIDRLVAQTGLSECTFDRLRRQTHALLSWHWDSVERVAEALLAHKRLAGHEIDALIEDTRFKSRR